MYYSNLNYDVMLQVTEKVLSYSDNHKTTQNTTLQLPR